MEGYLLKQENGFVSSWKQCYFILHEDTLNYLDKKEGKLCGSIHLKIAKISSVQKEPLLISIFTGTNDVNLKASSIKERVDWYNALINNQQLTFQGKFAINDKRKFQISPKNKNLRSSMREEGQVDSQIPDESSQTNWNEVLSMKFSTKVFKPDAPLFERLAQIWDLEAQLEENISLLQPEALKSKHTAIINHTEQISNLTSQMKTQITQCVQDIEDTRKEMFKVAKNMMKLKEQLLSNGNSSSPQRNQFSIAQSSLNNLKQQPHTYTASSPNNKINAYSSPYGFNNVQSPIIENNSLMGYGGIPITYTMRMRDQLPYLVPPDKQNFSIWAILKNFIGKDLSKITMPIWLNEPISMLQVSSQTMHYQSLLQKAVSIKNDDFKRLSYIAIYYMTFYTDQFGRTRKPFNPILGETYEIIQPDYRFMAEQVSHHPPITAFYFEGDGFYGYGNTNIKNSFWGSSLEFKVIGLMHLILKDTGEHIVIKRPENSANNLIVGKLYVDVHGKMEVTNLTKNIKTEINISRLGWTKKNSYKVEGKTCDSQGKNYVTITGKWNEYLNIIDERTGVEEEVFRMDPKPANLEQQYNFSYFTLNTNYIDNEMRKTLPPTDCRRRMDQRFMEEGRFDEAILEKERLENKQRTMRKEMEKQHIQYKPRFFVEETDEVDGEKCYKFNNIYWTKRKNHDWSDAPELF